MSATTENASKAKLALAIVVIGFAGFLTFVLGAWNQNLVLVIVSLIIPVALRSMRGKKFSIGEGIEMLVFGILLWNHLIIAIIILFILKVLVTKLRK